MQVKCTLVSFKNSFLLQVTCNYTPCNTLNILLLVNMKTTCAIYVNHIQPIGRFQRHAIKYVAISRMIFTLTSLNWISHLLAICSYMLKHCRECYPCNKARDVWPSALLVSRPCADCFILRIAGVRQCINYFKEFPWVLTASI